MTGSKAKRRRGRGRSGQLTCYARRERPAEHLTLTGERL